MPPAQELPLLEGRVGRSAVHAYLQTKEILEESSNLKTEVRVCGCVQVCMRTWEIGMHMYEGGV